MILLFALLACTREPPPDPCAVAWSELSALRDGLQASHPGVFTAPDEPTFRATCEALPPERRACLSPTYAASHPECGLDGPAAAP